MLLCCLWLSSLGRHHPVTTPKRLHPLCYHVQQARMNYLRSFFSSGLPPVAAHPAAAEDPARYCTGRCGWRVMTGLFRSAALHTSSPSCLRKKADSNYTLDFFAPDYLALLDTSRSKLCWSIREVTQFMKYLICT
jgi:hypothetical protein